MKVGNRDLVILSHHFLDVIDRDQAILERDEVLKTLGDKRNIYGPAGEKRARQYPAQRPLKLTHIRPDPLGHKKRYVFGQIHAFLLCLLDQNRHPRLELRWLSRNDQAGTKARD